MDQLAEQFPFASQKQRDYVRACNANGGEIVNDGQHYIVSGFDWFEEPCGMATSLSREVAESLVGQFKAAVDDGMALVIVQRGNDAVAWHLQEDDTWRKAVSTEEGKYAL